MNLRYGTSLFERLKQAGYPVKMLKTQYRMHPEVGAYVLQNFVKLVCNPCNTWARRYISNEIKKIK